MVALWGQEFHPLRPTWVMMRMWGGFGSTLGSGDRFEGTLVVKRDRGVALVAPGSQEPHPLQRSVVTEGLCCGRGRWHLGSGAPHLRHGDESGTVRWLWWHLAVRNPVS